MSNWQGKTIGKVYIESLIARGGMAEVFLGMHPTLNKKVAIKVMHDHMEDDPEAITRFQREARVVASLRHPNIVQVLDHDLVDGQPYLIMEYVPGPSLAAYLKELHKKGEQLPFAVINHLINSLAIALDYAHSKNIVHRDIKPANILLRSASGVVEINQSLPDDVEPIITDFGLVRILDASIQTSTGAVSGTPAYMSPEQARGDKVGILSDIYSLGVILYEMLAGTVPFDADTTFGILMKHLNEPPPPIPEISYELQAVVDRALAKDPALRFKSAGELSKEFTAIFDGQTISPNTLKNAELIRKSYEQPKPAPARTLWVWILAVTTLIGLGAGIFFLRSQSNASVENSNSPVGRVTYTDFNLILDKAVVSLPNVQPPAPGTHYEVWLLGNAGQTKLNIGKVELDQTGQGQLNFINPVDADVTNILEMYDQIEVAQEADNNSKPNEPGEVMYSSVFPPQALVDVRHLLVSFDGAPDHKALIQGLWSTTDLIDTSSYELQKAYDSGDEQLIRKKTEEIINQIVGKQNTELYKDWNGDGTLDDPGDGYGLLENGSGQVQTQGYIPETISYTQLSMQTPDATQNIIEQGQHVIISTQNIEAWAKELLGKAQELNGIPFGPEMKPLIAEITSLTNNMLSGLDKNKDGVIDTVEGESGADAAYESSYRMADMPLLKGSGRIPPPATTPQATP